MPKRSLLQQHQGMHGQRQQHKPDTNSTAAFNGSLPAHNHTGNHTDGHVGNRAGNGNGTGHHAHMQQPQP
jgi:hypothetical protein